MGKNIVGRKVERKKFGGSYRKRWRNKIKDKRKKIKVQFKFVLLV